MRQTNNKQSESKRIEKIRKTKVNKMTDEEKAEYRKKAAERKRLSSAALKQKTSVTSSKLITSKYMLKMAPNDKTGVITESMVEEEKVLEETAIQNDEKLLQDMKEKEENFSREMCYKRLEHLLNRSNFYTQFLLKRMKEQQEQKELKRKKQPEDVKKTKSVEQPAMRKTTRNRPASKNLLSSHENNSNLNSIDDNAKPNLRGSKKKLNDKNDNDLKENNLGKNTGKRKLNDSNKKLNISDYFTEESLAKRPKVEEKSPDKDKPVSDTFSRVINNEKVSDRQPSLFTGGIMRNYQLDGYEWLKLLYENGVNGILGDEMGLGKTIQCIALIAHLVDMGVPGPFLVCAPLSTLPNWVMEFGRFAPKVPIVLYHGSQDERQKLREKINSIALVQGKETKPVVITSYEMAMNDQQYLQSYHWRYLIVDEGHRLKNFNCRLVRELKRLNTANRLLLTGTPLQNNLSELWSLLNFLLPEIFDDLQVFQSWFDVTMLCGEGSEEKIIQQENEKQIIGKLHQILTPFLLRRVKADVALNIPPKREILVYAPLVKEQDTYYQAVVNQTIEAMLKPPKIEEPVILNDKGRPGRRCAKTVDYKKLVDISLEAEDDLQLSTPSPSISCQDNLKSKPSIISLSLKNTLMQLRKICNHPYLLEYPLDPTTEQYLVNEDLVKSSGKMQILDMMLQRLKSSGHKVLIFSQMTKMLDILEDFCYFRKYSFCRLDGSMKIQDRQEQILDFNRDPEVFIFLLSTRAGGLGINLTAADTVIIFDSDWNPQCDLQAQDRCHRIGQEKPVVVYRFVTSGTVDEKIVERAANKRKLEKMIIHKGKFKSGRASMENSLTALSTNELKEILKSQQHNEVVKSTGKIYSKKELDTLLDRTDLIKRMKCKDDSIKPKCDEISGVFKVLNEDRSSEIQI